MCKCKHREVWKARRLTHTRGLVTGLWDISFLNIITLHYWCFMIVNFVFICGFFKHSPVLIWKSFDKTRLIKVSNYLSSQHDQWQMECIFSFLPEKKKKENERELLMQDTKLFWFLKYWVKTAWQDNKRGRWQPIAFQQSWKQSTQSQTKDSRVPYTDTL